MKKLLSIFVVFLALSMTLQAQKRDDLIEPHEYSGPFVNTKAPTVESGLANFFKNRVRMSHSYSMNFGSFAGNFQNVNAYTNTMEFFFSDNLTGRVDVSFLHSPFGGNDIYGNGMQPQILVQNAELNYRISDNALIQFQYRQLPRGMGFGNPAFGNRFARNNPFNPFFY